MNATLTAAFRVHWYSIALIAVGTVFAVYGAGASPARTWPSLLLNGFYVTSLAVSAMFFLASQRLAGARWSAGLRRIPEALMLLLPVAAILMLLLFFGRRSIYRWSIPNALAGAIDAKVQYLQVPLVFGRMALALVLWIVFAWLFRTTSLRQDREPGLSLACHYRLNRYSAVFVVIFAISFTLGSYDWLISLDPSWSTTIFGLYVFAGTFVQGIAAVTLAAVLLARRGRLPEELREDDLHSLGKMLFAFSTFWAYIWVCEYLLIWYGNVPDEVTYYLKRTSHPWLGLFLFNLVLNWVIPFVVLLPARAKRNPMVLINVSLLLLCGHWLDLYILIMPSLWKAPQFGFPEFSIAAGYAALAVLLFLRNLARAPIVPLHDPVLAAEARVPVWQGANGERA